MKINSFKLQLSSSVPLLTKLKSIEMDYDIEKYICSNRLSKWLRCDLILFYFAPITYNVEIK